MAPKKTIEDTYQKKSQLEHVLHRPGMYIGDIENVTTERWVVDNGKFVRKTISYSPGLYKIFDEIFTNATDHSQRDTTMKKIQVNFMENGEISILNDGEGIPIEIHKELGKYVPEIIFGEFHNNFPLGSRINAESYFTRIFHFRVPLSSNWMSGCSYDWILFRAKVQN